MVGVVCGEFTNRANRGMVRFTLFTALYELVHNLYQLFLNIKRET